MSRWNRAMMVASLDFMYVLCVAKRYLGGLPLTRYAVRRIRFLRKNDQQAAGQHSLEFQNLRGTAVSLFW